MRRRIFEIIEIAQPEDRASRVYDRAMYIIILLSIVPLFFKEANPVFYALDLGTVIIFLVDYLLRWATAVFILYGKRNCRASHGHYYSWVHQRSG